MITGESNIVLFDGTCNLCKGIVEFIYKRDLKRKLNFIPLQSEYGKSVLRKFKLSAENFESIVFIQKEKYFLRSSAVLRILRLIGGIWRMFYILIIFPKPVRDIVYKIIARKRYKISGIDNSCATWAG